MAHRIRKNPMEFSGEGVWAHRLQQVKIHIFKYRGLVLHKPFQSDQAHFSLHKALPRASSHRDQPEAHHLL